MTTKLEAYALERIDDNRTDCANIIQKIGNRVKAHEHEQLCQLMRDFEFLLRLAAHPVEVPSPDKHIKVGTRWYTTDQLKGAGWSDAQIADMVQ